MILQQLWKDADAIMTQTGRGSLPPAMYSPKPIKWIVELSHDLSKPVHFTPTVTDKKKGIERLAPSMKRSSKAIRPHLFADKPSYSFGVRIADPKLDANRDVDDDTAHAAKQHQAYKSIVQDCATATGNADVAIVAKFLDGWSKHNPPVTIPVEMTRDDWLTFRVDDDVLPMELAEVQEFWAKAAAGEGAEETEEELELGLPEKSAMQCLVSGANGPVEEMMPVPVKGLYGGKSEMAIVSANANAFESYGLTRAQTSPISKPAGERFGQALNALLASGSHHQSAGRITYVFWARGGIVPLFAFQPPPDARDLQQLLTAIHRGDGSWANGLPSGEKFHLFGLTANAARVVVRSALDTTIGEIGTRQAAWFRRLGLIGPDGQPGRPLPLKTLSVAGYREFKDIAPGLEDALVQAVFGEDHRLPESLLSTLVTRCRLDTEGRVTYPRAALLKYILTQHLPLEEADFMSNEVTEVLPAGFSDREANAYHLGRLFCELESIQSAAQNNPNTTIADKFYGSASTAPAGTFGILLAGVKNHLSKMRRAGEKTARDAHFAQKRLDLIISWISDYPKTLTLREQSLFGLGYYQYRASRRHDISEKSVAKQRAAMFGTVGSDAVTTDDAAE